MKLHTTNYINTFIEVAEDCPVIESEIPVEKAGKPTIASMQYEMVFNNPYKYSSDDVIFHCFAIKNELRESELQKAREQFFSKGQACFRASPLTKRYGFGVHHNAEGKMAVYPVESEEYARFSADKTLKHVKGMKSKR